MSIAGSIFLSIEGCGVRAAPGDVEGLRAWGAGLRRIAAHSGIGTLAQFTIYR